jgi:hypothetical protein
MRQKFGAPVPAEHLDALVDYLTTIYSKLAQ